MRHFAILLPREQPRIAAAIAALTNALPAHVRPAAAYALSSGGKRLRPMLAVLVARALGYAADDMYALAATVELFHVATLLHDDILDNADLRRGRVPTHHKFGVPRTLLSADAMVSRAFKTLADTGDPCLMACLTRAVIGTADGEIMEIEAQGVTSGGLPAYTAIIEGKTACLLRASCELGALLARTGDDTLAAVSVYGLNLGMAFQIADDALDFAPAAKTGKPEGGDIREGKFTPPVAYYLESLTPEARARFLEKFAAHTFSEGELAAVVDAVRAGGFQERTLRLADSYLDKAAAALKHFSPAPGSDAGCAYAALGEAVAFVRDRTA